MKQCVWRSREREQSTDSDGEAWWPGGCPVPRSDGHARAAHGTPGKSAIGGRSRRRATPRARCPRATATATNLGPATCPRATTHGTRAWLPRALDPLGRGDGLPTQIDYFGHLELDLIRDDVKKSKSITIKIRCRIIIVGPAGPGPSMMKKHWSVRSNEMAV